jgi:YVTN family beta-propeller protein
MNLQHSISAPVEEGRSAAPIRAGQFKRVRLGLALGLLSGGVYAQTVTTTLPTGLEPSSVAVNPVTNKIYIADVGSSAVTVLDGLTNDSTTVPVGSEPITVAVNPVTNKIYVANYGSATVTVIDGETNSTATVKVGSDPTGIAINPTTDKIYVAGYSSTLTVIDGADNATTAVPVGRGGWIAVNPVTNTIYLAQQASSTLAVIDGATNAIKATLPVAQSPISLAVNPATNKIYVATSGSQVTVVNGATNGTTTIPIAPAPGGGGAWVAVNPVTNEIYVSQEDTGIVTVIDGATNKTTGIPAGSVSSGTGAGPAAVAVNTTTNQIYVCNANDKTVVVIDGASDATTVLPVGDDATTLAVNPITNKIYAPNFADNTVTVIDGATNRQQPLSLGAPTAVAVNPVTDKIYIGSSGFVEILDGATLTVIGIGGLGTGRASIAVNPVTNKIYVGFSVAQNLTVIDGATNATTTLYAYNAQAIAVNPVTNKIYVAEGDGSVEVIDGATNATTLIASSPLDANSIAVNPATNKIYVTNIDNQYVTVIDGATNRTQIIDKDAGPYGTDPAAVAVNPLTDKIYVANSGTANVTVIDGEDNSTTTVPADAGPSAVAVNPVTNKIYVLNTGDFPMTASDVTVIDGATSTAIATVPVSSSPNSLVVNPVTNKIYVTDQNDVVVIDGATESVTRVALNAPATVAAVDPFTNKLYVPSAGLIADHQLQPSPLTTTITPLAGNETSSPNPRFTFSVHGAGDRPTGVYFQVDTWQNAWTAATGSGSSYEGAVMTALQPGFHVLYAYAVDSSFLIGSIRAYGFLVHGFEVTQAASATSLSVNPAASIFGLPVVLTATVKAPPGIPSGAVDFTYGGTLLGTSFLDARGIATLTTAALPVGVDPITANYVGSEADAGSSSSAAATVGPAAMPNTLSLSPASGGGSQQAFTAVYSDPYGIADLDTVRLLINSSESTLNGCYVFYSPSTNELYMTDNAGSQTFPPFAPGPKSGSSAGNSQCTLTGAGSSVSISGNTISVTFALSFTSSFTGVKNVYLQALRQNGQSSGVIPKGTWNLPLGALTVSRANYAFISNPRLPQSGRIYVTNNSSGPISFSPKLQGSSTFKLTKTCPVIEPGAVCDFQITYTPGTLGNTTGTLNLKPDVALPSSNTTVALTGSAVAPSVTFSRNSLGFNAPYGDFDYERVYIANNLPYTLNSHPVITPNFKMPFGLQNDCSAIAAFTTCALNVSFSAVFPTPSEYDSEILMNFVNAPPAVPSTIQLQAFSSYQNPPILVSTTNVQLVTLLGTTASAPVSITNYTFEPISVSSSLSGSAAFTLGGNCSTLAPFKTCAIDVNYSPAFAQVDTAKAELTFANGS